MHLSAAEGFARDVSAYVRGRPEYPVAINSWLTDALGLKPSQTVVDLGAGTGKFTRRLLTTGAHVIAMEPVTQMLAQLTSAMPSVVARSGTAESIPLTDGAADVVVCAQAFHWFATADVLKEIYRVLRPGGFLGLVWNVRDETVPWVAEMTRIMEPFQGDTPQYRDGMWQRLFPAAGFGPLQEQRFPNDHSGPPEQVIVDRVMSTSFIAALARPQQRVVAARLHDLIATTPELAGREEVRVPYETRAFSCQRDG